MRSSYWFAFYQPGDSWLHRLLPSVKVVLLLFYMAVLLSSRRPLEMVILFLLIALAASFAPLTKGRLFLIWLAVALLLLVAVMPVVPAGVSALLLAFTKVMGATALLSLFSLTTNTNSLLSYLASNSTGGSTLFYLTQATFVALPLMEYDLRRAIDAERIRRGYPVQFYSAAAWVTILAIVLARSQVRAGRWAEALIDRGYVPGLGFGRRAGRLSDLVWAAVYLLPALVLLAWRYA